MEPEGSPKEAAADEEVLIGRAHSLQTAEARVPSAVAGVSRALELYVLVRSLRTRKDLMLGRWTGLYLASNRKRDGHCSDRFRGFASPKF